MSRHTVITSFSPAGWEEYGERFVETFLQHWDPAIRLVCFYEIGQPPIREDLMKSERVDWQPIDLVSGLPEFMRAVEYFPLMCGAINAERYDIQHDMRMGRKSFMNAHAVERFGGKVFWVDADVVTFAPVDAAWLDELLPDDKLGCYLGREKVYTESGFLGYNTAHPLARQFVGYVRHVFQSGAIVAQQSWHDCIAFDLIRQGLDEKHPGLFVNLGAGVDPGPGLQVFINSVLGTRMDHLKGNRKAAGSSAGIDLTADRPEEYWQKVRAATMAPPPPGANVVQADPAAPPVVPAEGE